MNNKLTIPIAILIGFFMIAVSILYTNVFNFSIIPEVKSEIAGMDASDLKSDKDFKKAVLSIVRGADFTTSGRVKEIVEDYGYATRSGVLSIVEGCLTTTDGQRVMNSCY